MKGSRAFAIYLSLGSNLGDRRRNLRRAVELLTSDGIIRVVRESSFYETSPVENLEQPRFLNSVVEISTELSPPELLLRTQTVEQQLNALPKRNKGPRTIDLDILLYGDDVSDSPSLKLPHPAICRRRFVLVPLLEIAPNAYCPP